jgi:diguanylate cyclase (GGDEF)-like protein
MKTYTINYSQNKSIDKFIREQNIREQDNILIQVFSGIINETFLKDVVGNIAKCIPQAVIIGSTTDGEINNKDSSTHTVILSISIFENTKLIPFFYRDDISYRIGEKIAQNTPKDTKVAIMFSDGLNSDGEDLINGVNSINKELIVSGGMAGDNGEFNKTFIFNDKEITQSGVVGVYLQNPNLFVTTEYNFGWINIGKEMTVTDSYKNIVYKVDGLPIEELYRRYLGDAIANKLPSIGVEFPLVINRNGVKIARAVLSKGKEGSLIFAGNVKVGEKVQFGVGNIQSILTNSNKNIKELTKNPIESIFLYSCMARRRFIGDKISYELESLSNLANVSGFYTYGEFFSKGEYKNLHNETSTILALSESKDTNVPCNRELLLSSPDTITAFTNLISTITDELDDLNKNLQEKVEEHVKKIEDMLYYDSLTGAYSKTQLEEDLKINSDKNLILLNVDNFSNINLAYGFEIGDIILRTLVKRLKSMLKVNIYRIDSDEFALLCNRIDCTDAIEFIRDNFLSHPITINNLPFRITFSFGIANFEIGGDLLQNASLALKDARNSGKNRYIVYSPDIHSEDKRKEFIDITDKLFYAISHDNIIPYYQGIRDNITGEINKYEVLVRMKINDTIYSPYTFLPAAKVSGRLSEISKIVIEKSFKYMSKKDYSFSINITEDDLNNGYLIDFLTKKSKEYNINPNRVYLEILEGMSKNSKESVYQIKVLKELGFKISIDDFGTEYSNFERIQEINADILKIDGKYIKDIDTNQKSYKIAKIISLLAKEMDMKVVAEFVHSKEVQKIIIELGIDYSQGFYFSEPIDKIKD